jgi:hypothetical protein
MERSSGADKVALEGDLSLFSLTELIQMICMGGQSSDIEVIEAERIVGAIAIRRGRVERCFAFGAWGAQAVFRLLALRVGRYRARMLSGEDEARSNSLEQYTWQELLMESARRQDEARREANVQTSAQAVGAGRVIPFPQPQPQAQPRPSGDWEELAFSMLPPAANASAAMPPPPRVPFESAPFATAPAASPPWNGSSSQATSASANASEWTPLSAPVAPISALAFRDEAHARENESDRVFREAFERGTAAFVQRRYREAMEAFELCAHERPFDPTTQVMLKRVQRDLEGNE